MAAVNMQTHSAFNALVISLVKRLNYRKSSRAQDLWDVFKISLQRFKQVVKLFFNNLTSKYDLITKWFSMVKMGFIWWAETITAVFLPTRLIMWRMHGYTCKTSIQTSHNITLLTDSSLKTKLYYIRAAQARSYRPVFTTGHSGRWRKTLWVFTNITYIQH